MLTLLAPFIVAAAINAYTVSIVDEVVYESSDGPEVVLTDSVDLDAAEPFPDSNSVNLSPVGSMQSNGHSRVVVDDFDDNGWTRLSGLEVDNRLVVDMPNRPTVELEGNLTSVEYRDVDVDGTATDLSYDATGPSQVAISDLPTETWLAAVDTDTGETVAISESDANGDIEFDLDSGSRSLSIEEADLQAPEISDENPANGSISDGYGITLSANISDGDFPHDEIDVEIFYEGESVHTETLTSNGTVETDIQASGGESSWRVETSDSYGAETIEEFTFSAPDTLYVRDERNPTELIDEEGVNLSIRVYSQNRTLEESLDDGTMNLTGVPVDETLVITAEADGWHDRRILIRDITTQQNIYLLEEGEDTVSMTFELEDRSGNFPAADSELYVQKALDPSGEEDLEWQTVTGDFFAADGRFVTTLAHNERYRVLVRNAEGDERVLGTYIPTESGITSLTIGRVVWSPPEGESVGFNADLIVENDQDKIRLQYNDTDGRTNQLDIRVVSREDPEDVLFETTQTDVSTYLETIALTEAQAETNWRVEVRAHRDGADFETAILIGDLDDLELPLDPMWLMLFGQIALVAIAALVVGHFSGAGGIVLVSVAFCLSWLGWVAIHPAALGIAGVIALLRALRARPGGGV